jgi:hypothetical protein
MNIVENISMRMNKNMEECIRFLVLMAASAMITAMAANTRKRMVYIIL